VGYFEHVPYGVCAEAFYLQGRLSAASTGICLGVGFLLNAINPVLGLAAFLSCGELRNRALEGRIFTSPNNSDYCTTMQKKITLFGLGQVDRSAFGRGSNQASTDLLLGGTYDVIQEILDKSNVRKWYYFTQTTKSFASMSFIPTVSSYALNATTLSGRNWGGSLTFIDPNNPKQYTPFDAISAPDNNQPHVQLTQTGVNFVREQIVLANQQQCGTTPPTPTPCSLAANACYTIQVKLNGQRIQAMADGTIQQQGANNQNNQIWKLDSEDNGRVRFTTQDGTNRVVKVDNGTAYNEWLSLGNYTGDDRQKWSLECNPANNAFWRISRNDITWDVKDFGNSPQLQLWGSTSESFFDYRSFQFTGVTCPTGTPPPPPPPTGGAFAVQNPQYNCQTGQLVMQTSGGDGSTVDYQISGLRGWGTDPNFTVPSWQLQGTAFTLQARQSGNIQTLSFTSSCNGGGTPPPPPPPTGGAFVITDPTFSCASGDLTINTSGGNGSAIEYQISGIRGWGSGATMNIPSWQRNGVAFTLQARQSGTEAPSRPFTASCGGGRLASVIEETVRLSVSPNPSRGLVRVRYWLAARQAGQLRVVSATGAILSEQTVVGTGQTEETTLSLDAHPAGLYLINLSSGTVHETAKVLLQR